MYLPLLPLAIVDAFSNWTEAIPVRSNRAAAAAKVLLEQVFIRWDLPWIIDSDQGTDFRGEIICNGIVLMGAQQKYHIADHPPVF